MCIIVHISICILYPKRRSSPKRPQPAASYGPGRPRTATVRRWAPAFELRTGRVSAYAVPRSRRRRRRPDPAETAASAQPSV